jgi:hypothetical protein
MSWALARAFEGAADADQDGILRRGELYDFVQGKVREFAEARQTPDFWPAQLQDLTLLRFPDTGTSAMEITTDEPLRLAIVGKAPSAWEALRDRRRDVLLVSDAGDAELVWEAASGRVFGGLGDLLAQNVTEDRLQQVVDKYLALRMLKLASRSGVLQTSVLPDDRTHFERDQITLTIDGIDRPFLTIVNLASDGTVQFLFPVKGDADRTRVGQPFQLGPVDVVAPFGADHVLAIATAEEPLELRGLLKRLNQTAAPMDAARALLELPASLRAQIGIQGIYTAPR